MSVNVNTFTVYDKYFTNEKLNSAILVREFDFSWVKKEISHFPAVNM